MKISLLAEVSKIEKKSRYQNKSGTTEIDWELPQVDYTQSTVTILNNAEDITGSVSLSQKLEYGQLVKIIVDTGSPVQVVERDEVTMEKVLGREPKNWP